MGRTTTSRTGRSGFTLVEILLALAVIALMATVIIGGSGRLLAGRTTTPDQAFWEAVRQARRLALEQGRDVLLSYDAKAARFTLTNGTSSKTVALAHPPQDFGLAFVPADSNGPQNLIAGVMVAAQSLPSVRFFSDGTCFPFRVQLHTSIGSHFVSIDPWTCAPMLTPLNPDGTPKTS